MHRRVVSALTRPFFTLLVLAIPPAFAQAPNVPAFLTQVTTKYPKAASVSSITLSGTATWIAGSDKESGPATLTALRDGSSSMQLKLDHSVQSESQTALGDARTCQWLDHSGKTQQKLGPDCASAFPWFAPIFFMTPLPATATRMSIADGGEVSSGGLTQHQTTYVTSIKAPNAALANKLTAGTSVRVLSDPQTLLPKSIEYTVHSDKDLNAGLSVRVEYDNYQNVSGIGIPYLIKRYVNNTLQLTITVDSVNLN